MSYFFCLFVWVEALRSSQQCFSHVGTECGILYPLVRYLYVSGSGSITLGEEERANLSAIVYL